MDLLIFASGESCDSEPEFPPPVKYLFPENGHHFHPRLHFGAGGTVVRRQKQLSTAEHARRAESGRLHREVPSRL